LPYFYLSVKLNFKKQRNTPQNMKGAVMDSLDEEDKLNEVTLHIKEAESLSKIILNSLLNEHDNTETDDAVNAISILTEKLSKISLLLTQPYLPNG